jgi:hypothetical protein
MWAVSLLWLFRTTTMMTARDRDAMGYPSHRLATLAGCGDGDGGLCM